MEPAELSALPARAEAGLRRLPGVEDVPLHCEDLGDHGPPVGGITLSNACDEAGRLGCFATINGEDGRGNVVISNNHVLAAFGAAA